MIPELYQLPEPDGKGRSILFDVEWEAIKQAIDCYRANDYTLHDIQTLEYFDLWDADLYALDETAVTKLYMENT